MLARRPLCRRIRAGRTAMIAATAAAAVVLGACSGPATPGLAQAQQAADAIAALTTAADPSAQLQELLGGLGLDGVDLDNVGDDDHDGGLGGDGSSGESGREAPPPIFWWLGTLPAGDPAAWQRLYPVCDDPKATSGAFASIALPGDWEYSAMGSAGNSPLSMRYDYTYLSPEAGRVNIAIDSDDIDLENPAALTEPFDRDMEVTGADGTKEYHIAFEQVGTVPVGQGNADLFKAEANQAPVMNSETEYKARVRHVDMPQAMWDGTWLVTEQTVVVTVSFDPDKGELPLETVRGIIGSLSYPQCSVDRVIIEAEMTSNTDMNADGYVSTMEDFQKMLGIG